MQTAGSTDQVNRAMPSGAWTQTPRPPSCPGSPVRTRSVGRAKRQEPPPQSLPPKTAIGASHQNGTATEAGTLQPGTSDRVGTAASGGPYQSMTTTPGSATSRQSTTAFVGMQRHHGPAFVASGMQRSSNRSAATPFVIGS